jgi:hypothetical protein
MICAEILGCHLVSKQQRSIIAALAGRLAAIAVKLNGDSVYKPFKWSVL